MVGGDGEHGGVRVGGADVDDEGVEAGRPGGTDREVPPAGENEVAGADVLDGDRSGGGADLGALGDAEGVMGLRATELVGLVGGVEGRGGAVGPGEAALGRLVVRGIAGGMHSDDAGGALDQDVAGVGGGAGHDDDVAAGVGEGAGADPLGPHARFAEAATGQGEGVVPGVVRGQQLLGAAPERPVVGQAGRVEAVEDGVALGRGEQGDLLGERERHAGSLAGGGCIMVDSG